MLFAFYLSLRQFSDFFLPLSLCVLSLLFPFLLIYKINSFLNETVGELSTIHSSNRTVSIAGGEVIKSTIVESGMRNFGDENEKLKNEISLLKLELSQLKLKFNVTDSSTTRLVEEGEGGIGVVSSGGVNKDSLRKLSIGEVGIRQ